MQPDLSMTPELAMRLVKEAETMEPGQIAELRRNRLWELLDHARKHSPLLREKYRNLPENPELAAIPPLRRQEAAPHLADWLCDRDVDMDALRVYLSDINNMLEPFMGKYTVLTTSGTTDVPLTFFRDARNLAVNSSLVAGRLLGGSKLGGIPRLSDPSNLKIMGIIASAGFHATYLAYLKNRALYEKMGKSDNLGAVFVEAPLEEKVRAFNEFQPDVVSGYPSSLGVLAAMQKAGELHIHPLAIICSAEHLSMETLRLMEDAFKAPVMDNYCSSEGGEVAFLCRENRMHVNSDWMIVEPVDADLNPVPAGTVSDGILMTNLANLIQPVIRYHMTDRITYSEEPCPCGLPFPHIKIEGRSDDVLSFSGKRGRPVVVEPITLLVKMMDCEGCLGAQFIQRSPDEMEIRWQSVRPADRALVGERLLESVRRDLSTYGAGNVTVRLSEEPFIVGKSGKIRTTLKAFA